MSPSRPASPGGPAAAAPDARSDARPDGLERWLIRLAWVGPLALVVLSRWQMSLDQWYVPLTSPDLPRMSEAVADAAQPWLATLDSAGGRRLFLITDADCPCTQPATQRVQAAMAAAQATFPSPIRLDTVRIDDPKALADPHWRQVVQQIPATPSLIVVDGQHLRYVGPAVSGSLCIGDASVSGLLGAAGGSSGAVGTAVNYIDEGCYCAVAKAPETTLNPPAPMRPAEETRP